MAKIPFTKSTRTDFDAERKAKANARFNNAVYDKNKANFNSSWKVAADQASAQALKIMKESISTLCNDIVKDTPVKTGNLRGNWIATLNTPDTDVVNTLDVSGNKAKSNISSALRNYTLKDTIFFSNNIDYSEEIEYGSSKQAPFGMVRINAARFGTIVQNISNRFKK